MSDPETDSVFDSIEFLRRLVKRYQPGHWIGGLRRANCCPTCRDVRACSSPAPRSTGPGSRAS